MSLHIAGLLEAILVMSRKPPAAKRFKTDNLLQHDEPDVRGLQQRYEGNG